MDKQIIKFYATWCGPCKMIKPVVDKLASETGIPLVEIDIDENPEFADAYNVQGVPTLVLVEDGEEVARHVGLNTQARISAALGL